MPTRKTIPDEVETEVLVRSGRRCCICFGLKTDFTEKKGQIAHLNRDPSNANLDNLVFLCLEHHDEYDTRKSQSKGLTIDEVKEYRAKLYNAITQMRNRSEGVGIWPIGLDVPLLRCSQRLDAIPGIPTPGILFSDKDPSGSDGPPLLYLSVYFKPSRLFAAYLPPSNEKWLYLEANMRFALNLRFQVRAWNERDVFEFVDFLRRRRGGYDLHGPRPEDRLAGDYFYVWQENGENRLIMSTFTPTNAGISIHARFSDDVAKAFADYLDEVGFTKPFDQQ